MFNIATNYFKLLSIDIYICINYLEKLWKIILKIGRGIST